MSWCKTTTTACTTSERTNKVLLWLAWLLATCGFGILLAGVTSMQSNCGDTVINQVTVGYLAPISCDHFFQYTWWITYLHWFVGVMVFTYLVSRVLNRTRIALVGLCAVAAVVLMDTANTYLYFNNVPGLTSIMAASTKVTVAGAVVSAVADLLLMMLLGWTAEKDMYHHREEHFTTAARAVPMTGTATKTPMPAATAV